MLQPQPRLYWKDNSVNETGFVIERKASGGSYKQLANLDADQTQYTDSTAESGITYCYRVKAVNGSLSSGYTNEAIESYYSIPEVPKVETPDSDTSQVSMVFTLNKNYYTVNEVTKSMDVSPILFNGRTLLPIRFAADPIGAETAWDGNERKVTVTLGTTKLELWIGSNKALFNGTSILIDPDNPDVMPLIINSRTMLPMRFVTEKLGCDVEWVPADKQIKVNYHPNYLNPQPEPPR
jgi:hypothetical protein